MFVLGWVEEQYRKEDEDEAHYAALVSQCVELRGRDSEQVRI